MNSRITIRDFYIDSEFLDGEKIDFKKVNPIIWTICVDFGYYKLGERVGNV